MTILLFDPHQDGISTDLDLDLKPGSGSGSGPFQALTLVCIFNSPSLNPFLILGFWRIIYKSFPVDWSTSDLFLLPFRQLIQVSVVHQFLQLFSTFSLSRWCTWVISTIILVAGTRVVLLQEPCDKAVWAAWKQQKNTENACVHKTNRVAWRHHWKRLGE